MKTLLTFFAVFLGVTVSHELFVAPRVAEAGVANCSSKNGDTNADGEVDLSDAVSILGNLFFGSPAEFVPLCKTPSVPLGLPDTGQTKCYAFDESQDVWVQTPCGGATCSGQDGAYATGCGATGRFVDNRDRTVTDTCTGLMWQKSTADTNGDGQSTIADEISWCGALAYCESLSLAGHDDWRLPNIRELQSIVDYGRLKPAIAPVLSAFSGSYLSSTSTGHGRESTWRVDFSQGFVNYVHAEFFGHVRAVRSGLTAAKAGGQGGGVEKCSAKNGDVNADGEVDLSDAVSILGNLFVGNPPELLTYCSAEEHSGLPDTGQSACYDFVGFAFVPIDCGEAACLGQDGAYATGCEAEGRFSENGDGTVTDNCTGLMWQQYAADIDSDGRITGRGDYLSLCEALSYCEGLSFAGHDDWRLPNIRELQSIADYGRASPAPAIASAFRVSAAAGQQVYNFMSSTCPAATPDFRQWSVFFDVGDVCLADGGYVRTVRSLR